MKPYTSLIQEHETQSARNSLLNADNVRHVPPHQTSPRALEISVSVAFSASLTCTPPIPRKPPSVDASATCSLIGEASL